MFDEKRTLAFLISRFFFFFCRTWLVRCNPTRDTSITALPQKPQQGLVEYMSVEKGRMHLDL